MMKMFALKQWTSTFNNSYNITIKPGNKNEQTKYTADVIG